MVFLSLYRVLYGSESDNTDDENKATKPQRASRDKKPKGVNETKIILSRKSKYSKRKSD
jgi:hypothetical protein